MEQRRLTYATVRRKFLAWNRTRSWDRARNFDALPCLVIRQVSTPEACPRQATPLEARKWIEPPDDASQPRGRRD